MDLVEQLAVCSQKLLDVIQEEQNDRDVQVQNIERLLAEREQIIVRLKEEDSEPLNRHPLAMQILQMEQEIQKGIYALYEQIKQDLQKWNAQKRMKNAYNHLFSNVEIYDGRFYDKRK